MKRGKKEPWYDGPIGRRLRGVWWWTRNGAYPMNLIVIGVILWIIKAPDDVMRLFGLLGMILLLAVPYIWRSVQWLQFSHECGLDADTAWRLLQEWRRYACLLPNQAIWPECRWSCTPKPVISADDDGRHYEIIYEGTAIRGTDCALVAHAGRWLMDLHAARLAAARRLASRLLDLGFTVTVDETATDHDGMVTLRWPLPVIRAEKFIAKDLAKWERALNELPARLAEAKKQAAGDHSVSDPLAIMTAVLYEPAAPATGLSPVPTTAVSDASLSPADWFTDEAGSDSEELSARA